jgi:stearoyl-CoA desaturase (delta-9 desaturase)
MYICVLSYLGMAKVKKVPPKPVLSAVRPADDQTLEAVIANRYEIMARYSKTLQRCIANEFQNMQEFANHLKDARDWLYKDEVKLSSDEKQKLEELMKTNPQLRKMIEMRRELHAIWGRSNATREQLLGQLRSWCHRAEEAGPNSLKEFSLRLRRYSN